MDQAEWKAVTSEFEVEPAWVVTPDGRAQQALVRVFRDQGGLIRIDLSPMKGDDIQMQIVMGAQQLARRIADPQEPIPPSS